MTIHVTFHVTFHVTLNVTFNVTFNVSKTKFPKLELMEVSGGRAVLIPVGARP